MSDAIAIACGAISPLGVGDDAFSSLELGARARVAIIDDLGRRNAGFPRWAVAPATGQTPGVFASRDITLRALSDCTRALDRVRPSWRSERVGLVLGTSSGGMAAAEQVIACLATSEEPPRAICDAAAYGSPFAAARKALGIPLTREAHVLVACASSTFALGLAHAWLSLDVCDVALAGGYDALSDFVIAGFGALGAITASRPRPFRQGRDGLAAGEGAAVAAFVRADRAMGATPIACIAGMGASTDAFHITAPHPAGRGVVSAARAALGRAGVVAAEIDLVSAHATATPFNDAAESCALRELFGNADTQPRVHAMKGEVGHLMGAAGILETLAAARALRHGVAPASAGSGVLDPALAVPVRILERAERFTARVALKLSSAFGGANVALVLRAASRSAPVLSPRGHPRVVAEAWAANDWSLDELALRVGVSRDKLARADETAHLALGAVALLAEQVERRRISEAALVVGHDFANVHTNELFYRRILKRGPRGAEPRRFPATSPNATAGEVAIAFGMHGLSIAVGGVPGEPSRADVVASDCLAVGLVASAVVVDVWAGPSALAMALAPRACAEGPRARARLFVAETPRVAELTGQAHA